MNTTTAPFDPEQPHDQLTEILTGTYRALRQAQEILTALTDRDTDGLIKWGFAECEVIEVLIALEYAPSIQPTLVRNDFDTLSLAVAPIESLHTMAEGLPETLRPLTQNLFEAAELAESSADKLACLRASLHAGRLRKNLR